MANPLISFKNLLHKSTFGGSSGGSNLLISLDFSSSPKAKAAAPRHQKDVRFQLLSAEPGPAANPLIHHAFFGLDLLGRCGIVGPWK
jgi:hypothetical protein